MQTNHNSDTLTVKITPNDRGNPAGKLADAELHFGGESLLTGLKLIGFSIWERRGDGRHYVSSKVMTWVAFDRGIKSLIEVYVQAKKAGDLRETMEQDHEVDHKKTIVLVRYLPEGKDYPAYQTNIYIDQETLLPIMVEGFGPHGLQDDFICRYLYKDLDFNVKLTDADFTPEKNEMKAPQ